MSWKDNLLDASFRGVRFDVQGTRDQIDNALAEHEIAYVDGANVEDLGERARRIHLKAIFYGDDYDVRLQALINALRHPGSGELIHPVFGQRIVQRQSFAVEHHADLVNGCMVDLNFIESLPEQPFFSFRVVSSAADDAADGALKIDHILSNLFAFEIPNLASSFPGLTAVNALVNQLHGRISSLIGRLGYQGSTLISLGQTIVNLPRAWLSDTRTLYQGIAQPLYGLLKDMRPSSSLASSAGVTASSTSTTGVTTTTGTPSVAVIPDVPDAPQKMRTWRAMMTTVNGALVRHDMPVVAPGHSVDGGNVPIVAVPSLAVKQLIVQGQALAVAAETILAAAVVVDAASAVLADEVNYLPVLGPIEVEVIATDVRVLLQRAIHTIDGYYTQFGAPSTARPVAEALRQSAYQIQEAARAAINRHPPLLVRPAPLTGSLALIAHAWYGDWTRCTELARLNPQVRMPNFIAQGQVLNAYAK